MTDLAQDTLQFLAEAQADNLPSQGKVHTRDERLENRLQFEELIADLSARFVNVLHDRVDSEIECAFAQVLEFFQVDRCGLLEVSPDRRPVRLSHAAYAEGVERMSGDIDLAALFPWCYERLVGQGEFIRIERLEDLPEEASQDRQSQAAMGIRSMLDIPLFFGGRVSFVIAIDTVNRHCAWPEEYIPRLRLLGEIFVNALERQRARLEMDERLRFERMISDLSASFVKLPPDGVEVEIERWLRPITEFFAADRCNIEVFSEDHARATRAFEFCLEGIESAAESLSMEQLPWYLEQLIRGEPVVLNRVEDLPVEAESERQFCLAKGLKSVLSVPMVSQGITLGFCALSSVREARIWPQELVQRFRLVGEVFANALAHKRADNALRQAALEHRTILDFTYDWEYWAEPDGTLRYISPSCERITGYTPWEFMTTPSLLREIVVKEDRKCWDEHLGVAREAHRQVEIQFRIRRRDEGVRWIEHICRPVRRVDGTYLGLRISNRDITERKRVEEELQAKLSEIEILKRQLEHENVNLREEVKFLFGHAEIVCRSGGMKEVLAQAQQVAPTDSTVLILGETGTGKEPLARMIKELSKRKANPLVTVNCAALHPSLIESELFGREKGAYTGAMTSMAGRFEAADRATIFLDEIGELPLEVQAKLLRVLEEGRFERLGSSKSLRADVRVIAATNRNLEQLVREGKFRGDLYYRLNVFPITIPPLRVRPEDIPLLVWEFVRQFEKKMGKRIDSVPRQTIEALQSHPWPGNVRELRNVIEHAMIVSAGSTLEVRLPTMSPIKTSIEKPAVGSLEEIERKHILDVLWKTGWRITGKGGAAEILGLKRTTLQSRMSKLGIKRPTSDSATRK